MPSSSLIFVLVVAIWAAYLLQHWIRRRDHLSTARSVDRFSEAMRVLERRRPLPESPLAAPEPRSYAVAPARSQRAEVTVKRAAPQPVPGRAESAAKVRLLSRLAKLLPRMTMRRLRGASLVLAVVLVAASIALVALGRLVWWVIPAAVGLLVLDLLLLRHAGAARRRRARHEHAARTAQRVRERRVAQGAGRRVVGRRSVADQTPTAPTAAQADRRVDTVYDPDVAMVVDAPTGPEAATTAAPVAQDPHGWQPRPVPPPTYTLKARAERPAVAPAAVTPSPEPFDRAAAASPEQHETTTAEGEPAKRTAEAPYGRDLPFDGLALDEELEDLPPAYAVG